MSNIKIIKDKIPNEELGRIVEQFFNNMIKIVVDVEQELIALGGDLHADEEQALLEQGSKQENLWGANFYPNKEPGRQIEYISLINIRPSQNNRDMEIEDEETREKVKQIVEKLLI